MDLMYPEEEKGPREKKNELMKVSSDETHNRHVLLDIQDRGGRGTTEQLWLFAVGLQKYISDL